MLNRLPGTEDTENGQKGRQKDQKEADAINPQFITDPIGLDPPVILYELHLSNLRIKDEKERERDEKLDEGKEQGDNPEGLQLLLVNEEENNSPKQWKKDQEG
jgi:hypothetical protein